MPPALSFPAPSQSLLRFLRARVQSEGLAVFAPSHALTPLPRCAARSGAHRPICCPPQPRRDRSLLEPSATSKRNATDLLSPRRPAPKPSRKPGGPASRRTREFSTTPRAQSYTSGGGSHDDHCRPSWQNWLFGNSKKAAERLNPGDLPRRESDSDSGSIFPRRSLSAKAALDPRLRCTEVDGEGKVIMVDGEFKKSELIAKFGLLPRDLRKIDSSNLPHILVRPSAILLNLLHLKVLIKHDRVLLFDVFGSKTSYPQSAFMYDLQGKLQQKQVPGTIGGLPYEFRALEAVLMSVTSELEADFEAVREPVIRVLSELEDDIDREKLRILLVLAKRVTTFEQKAKLVRDAIDELLEADDDLSSMYLTEKTHDLVRGEDDHTEVEMLLESYNKICDEVYQEASNLVSSIRNTEEIIRAILDANRNALMLLDLKFSIATLGLAMGTFLAGLYGMNLENFIEETNWGFGAVTAFSSIVSLIVGYICLVKVRKVQRIKMSGPTRRDLNWFRDDDVLLDPRNRERLRRINMLKGATSGQNSKRWF
ncbi:cora-domain-containing protein [Thozetella sp. PMI_491]|nr:cora-domain-containing protein [Thozetella sp. PMI_491]